MVTTRSQERRSLGHATSSPDKAQDSSPTNAPESPPRPSVNLVHPTDTIGSDAVNSQASDPVGNVQPGHQSTIGDSDRTDAQPRGRLSAPVRSFAVNPTSTKSPEDKPGRISSELHPESLRAPSENHPGQVDHGYAEEGRSSLPERLKTPTSPIATASVNKRKRFTSEDSEDLTGRPDISADEHVHQARASGRDDTRSEDDQDDAPEVLSSKMAAREALKLPTSYSGGVTRKRRRTRRSLMGEAAASTTAPDATRAGEIQLDTMDVEDGETSAFDDMIAPDVADAAATTTTETLQPAMTNAEDEKNAFHNDNLEPSTALSAMDETTNLIASTTPSKPPNSISEVLADVHTNPRAQGSQALPEIPGDRSASDEAGDSTLPNRQHQAVNAVPLGPPHGRAPIIPADVPNVPASPSLPTEARETESHPTSGSRTVAKPSAAAEDELQTPSKAAMAKPVSQPSHAQNLPPPSSKTATAAATTPASKSPAEANPLTTVLNPKSQPNPPRRPRPHEPPLDTETSKSKSTSTSKKTSLQTYRDRLLNRHPRTKHWGPPGFRSTKFVGV